jgi:hypothetical protein
LPSYPGKLVRWPEWYICTQTVYYNSTTTHSTLISVPYKNSAIEQQAGAAKFIVYITPVFPQSVQT